MVVWSGVEEDEKEVARCDQGETTAAKRVGLRWSCLSRRNAWLLPLARGENENQARRSRTAQMSKICVDTAGEDGFAVGYAGDG